MFLTQFLGPSTITRIMEPRIRETLDEMIGEIAGKGEVDMAWDFARVFPVRIFMSMMGFPKEMFDDFLEWEWNILHSNSLEKMQWALRNVLQFLRGFIAEKEKNPDNELTSKIIHGTVEGRKFTEDEKIGMVWFLWLGGLDTVAATISQMYRRMAMQPEIQTMLRGHPELTNGAVDEFLRTQPILSSGRRAVKDFEWHGLQIKASTRRAISIRPGSRTRVSSIPLARETAISRWWQASTPASAGIWRAASCGCCSICGSSVFRNSGSSRARIPACSRGCSRSATCRWSGM
jgi:cytochrome P450